MPEVLRSLPDPAFLSRLVEREWGVAAEPVRLHRTLANDVYRVGDDHFLKVYRHGWRTPSEVAWECDLIAHLRDHDVPVVTVTPRRDGEPYGLWRAPEGPRPLVLMERLPGSRPTPPFTPAAHHRYGRIVAAIHSAGDGFTSRHERRPRDLDSMLDEPLAAIAAVLDPADRSRASRLADVARAELTRNPPTRGLCHGDATMDNVVEGDRPEDLAIFDFDLAAEGFVATDFPFGIDNWDHFLAGYREAREVHPDDLAAAPWLAIAGALENLRFHAVVKPAWRGAESTDEGWLAAALTRLRELADTHLDAR